ncbi:MAG: hypothetical protein R3E97_11765 [Candidatus Eisenbacteria bacterium]
MNSLRSFRFAPAISMFAVSAFVTASVSTASTSTASTSTASTSTASTSPSGSSALALPSSDGVGLEYDGSSSSDEWGSARTSEAGRTVSSEDPAESDHTGPWFLESGTRLRVRSDSGDWAVGTVAGIDDGVIQLALVDTSLVLQVPARRARIQVQSGETSHVLGGAGIGALVGAILGANMGASGKKPWSPEAASGADRGFGVGLVLGAVMGGVFGGMVEEAIWSDVSYPSLADGSSEAFQRKADAGWMWDQAVAGDDGVRGEEPRVQVAFDLSRTLLPEVLRR